jgi:hypothetical protein
MGLLDWSIPVHGNYVGPGYTGGQRHPRVGNYKIKPVDKLDALARKHDYRYEKGQSVAKADADMAKEALKLFTEDKNPLDLVTAAVLGAKSLIAEDNGVPLTEVPAELDPDSTLSVKTVAKKHPNNKLAIIMTKGKKGEKVKFIGPRFSNGQINGMSRKGNKGRKKPTHSATHKELVLAVSGKTHFTKQPKFLHGTKPGSIRVQRVEYLGELNAAATAGAFIINSYNINPGISLTFPWLANLAAKFEKYFIHSLRIECCPRVASTTPGGNYIACDYDAGDIAPLAKNTLFQLGTYADAQAWEKLSVSLNKGKLNSSSPHHFVRTGPLAANLDIKTYDCGIFFVATDATPVSVNTGTGGSASYSLPIFLADVYIEYDIELIEPSDALGSQLNYWQNTAASVVSTDFQLSGTNTVIYNLDAAVAVQLNSGYMLYFYAPGTWQVSLTLKVNTSSGTTGIVSANTGGTSAGTPTGFITNANYEVCSSSSSGGTSAYFTVAFVNASPTIPGTVYFTAEGSASSYGPCSLTTTRLN